MGKEPIKRFTYAVEEKHRGKWQPIKADDGNDKTVFITEESAEQLNIYSDDIGERYVKKGGKSSKKEDKKEESKDTDLDAMREIYEKEVGKKAYHGWDVPTLKEKIAEHKEK